LIRSQPAGGGFVGLLRELGAGFHVIIDGLLEGRMQLAHLFGVKADDVVNIGDMTNQDIIPAIELDACGIALVCQGVHKVFMVSLRSIAGVPGR
jgi:hypothetical protein